MIEFGMLELKSLLKTLAGLTEREEGDHEILIKPKLNHFIYVFT